MLSMFILVSLFCTGECLNIRLPQPSHSDKLLECVTDLIKQYFHEEKVVTYVGNKFEDELLLQAIHNENTVSVISRKSSTKLMVSHRAYLISVQNIAIFTTRFVNITKEPSWNPTARFLVIVNNLTEKDLNTIFNVFLKTHVSNVVVVNATADAHLYSYNPFDNYACGKRYDTIIAYGKCSEARSVNLYPKKLHTGLRNCTFSVSITDWPPYTILAEDNSNPRLRFGAEPYLFQIIGELEGFKIEVVKDYSDSEEFSSVSNDMQAVGVLKRIQDSKVDGLLGGMLLIPSRAAAFSYVYGHLVYTDEIRFVVKRASYVRAWRYLYLEFDLTVWVLLIVALLFYSVLVTMLLRTKDRSYIVLMLLDNIILHGRNIPTRWVVKCVLILWVWFAYLVNSFYQSSLFSFTTHPVLGYQISTEEDIIKYDLKPCFGSVMGNYYKESIQSLDEYHQTDGCYGLVESVITVGKSKNLYTIILLGVYQYNKLEFNDEYGSSQVITLTKPYSNVIYSIYLYKGFPLIERLRHRAIQLRENGLVEKAMGDMNYRQQIKHSFHKKEYRSTFAIPWMLYIAGCGMSFITFIIEIIFKRIKN